MVQKPSSISPWHSGESRITRLLKANNNSDLYRKMRGAGETVSPYNRGSSTAVASEIFTTDERVGIKGAF